MKKLFFLLIVTTLLSFSSLAINSFGFCRYEDGFYDCKGVIISSKNNSEKKLNRIIIEIEGCLLKQIVSINDEPYKNDLPSRIEIDDSGIIEVLIADQKYVIQIGKEMTLTP